MFSQYSHLVKRIFDLPIQVSSGPDEEHEIDRDIGTITKEKEPELKKPPLYKVVLINDDYTPMEFVVEILRVFFGMNVEKATQVMLKVHTEGKEYAEYLVRMLPRQKPHKLMTIPGSVNSRFYALLR